MWRWQPRNVHRRYALWAKLCITSAAAHVVMLFFLFFVYSDRLSDYALTISRNLLRQDVSILIMQAQMAPRNRIVADAASQKKVTQSEVKKTEPQRAVQKKQIQKPTVKTAVVSEQKKPAPRQVKQAKPKVAQQKKVEPPKKEVPAVAQSKPIQQNVVTQDLELPIAIEGELYDAETLLRLVALQKEFVRCWKPPVGMPEDCLCEVSIFVDVNGKVKTMDMVKTSGVLMYDVAARSALHEMELPRWTRGKTLTITFKE